MTSSAPSWCLLRILSAPATAAPHDPPAKMPSSRTSRRVMSKLSRSVTWTTLVDDAQVGRGRQEVLTNTFDFVAFGLGIGATAVQFIEDGAIWIDADDLNGRALLFEIA